MYIVHAERGKALCLGREGENLARQIVFDLYEWQELFGEGVVQLVAQRVGDTEPYPCVVEMDGNHAVWTITNADTAMPGNYGKCELSYYVGDTLVKSETFVTIVLDAMCKPSEEAPEPYQWWLDKILAAGSYAEAERIKAETAASAAALSEKNAKASEEIAAQGADRAEAAKTAAETAKDEALAIAGNTVRFTKQELTEAQKAQARTNIGAVSDELLVGGDTLTWDGDTTGLGVLPLGTVSAYKVSDAIVTVEDLANGVVALLTGYGETVSASVGDVEDGNGICCFSVSVNDVVYAGVYCIYDEAISASEGVPAGVYFLCRIDGVYLSSLTIPGYTGFGKETLDPNYLPEHTHSWDKLTDKPFEDKQEVVDTVVSQVAPVSYNEQELTEEQKAQARANIGAATVEEILARMPIFTLDDGTLTIE